MDAELREALFTRRAALPETTLLAEALFAPGWCLPLAQQLAAMLLAVREWPIPRGEFLAAMP